MICMMETNINVGRSDISRPRSEVIRKYIPENVSSQKDCRQCENILLFIIIILTVAVVAMLALYIINMKKVCDDCTSDLRTTITFELDVSQASTLASIEVATTRFPNDTSAIPTPTPSTHYLSTETITHQSTHLKSADTIATTESIPQVFFEIATTLNKHIDYGVDPCDDFYQFACGNAIRMFKNWGHMALDFATILSTTIAREKHDLIQQPVTDDDLPIIQKTKLFYKTCLDLGSINQRGVQPLKELLMNELGGWPLTYSKWKESSFDLVTILTKINLLGGFPVIKIGVVVDSKDNRKKRISIDQPTFVMPDRSYYLADRHNRQIMAYEELIAGIASVLGLADNDIQAAEYIQEFVDFEIKLTQISETVVSQRESRILYNPMTLKDVQGNYSRILNWNRYAQILMTLPEVQIDVTNEEIILNKAPLYFQKLANVINNTPTRTIANYIIWTLVHKFVVSGMVGTLFKDHFSKYGKIIPGVSLNQEWQKICLDTTTSVFPLPVGRLFIEKHFDPESKVVVESQILANSEKSKALDMVAELKKAFNELLEESDWLDEQTKQYAEEKNNQMSSKIGYPDYLYNNTYIEEKYSGLEVGTKFFDNMIMFNRYSSVDSLRNLRKPFNKDEWVVPATEINALYANIINEIIFPAGILHPPFYYKKYPKSINFSKIGSIIGHEITHGFDDSGRHYGKDGHLYDWWSNEAEENFKTKAQCMIDQYENFVYEPTKIKAKGVQTLGENIADNGGLRQAFRAYRNWVKSRGKEEMDIPGLNFTHNQIFFISYAQASCRLKPDELARIFISIATHSLSQFRIRGSVQNSQDFAKAFNCPIESKMNPSKKCQVW